MSDKSEIETRIRDIDTRIRIHQTQIYTMRGASVTELKNQISNLQAEKAELIEELGAQQAQKNSSEEKDDLDLDFSSIKDDSSKPAFYIDKNEVQ